MNKLPHVLAARPIQAHEFIDAVRATCPPRFPRARGYVPREVVLAISGGVDSMALAFLCSQFPLNDLNHKVSDNPVACFRGITIDHRLRPGSRAEAEATREILTRDIGIRAQVYPLFWDKILIETGHRSPNDLPNLESAARRLRYRTLGHICKERRAASLFLAHHEDDQYETVMMRLLQGHGTRGLRGMWKAGSIPECEGIMGAYRSGYVDDQRQVEPYYNDRIPKGELQRLGQELRSKTSQFADDTEIDVRASKQFHHAKHIDFVSPPNIEVEDGGLFVYRPLLEFSKDRLIATCLANRIQWSEDHTNQDPTLTLRNAIRHMYKGYTLPVALQKPSILALSKRCEQKVQNLDTETNRLLSRIIIHGFEPKVGTLTVELPDDYGPPRSRRYLKSSQRRETYMARRREIASLLIQKLISIVTPNLQPVPLDSLQKTVSFLFPALSDPNEAGLPDSPKPFNVSGVYFIPIHQDAQKSSAWPETSQIRMNQLSWFLTREPYTSNLPVPRYCTPCWVPENKGETGDRRWAWSPTQPWQLWDGRFWIEIKHHLPYRVIVQPFVKEHAKPFREQLPPRDRKQLEATLRRCAPGKVRYTMPAIYLEEKVDLNDVRVRQGYPHPRAPATDEENDPLPPRHGPKGDDPKKTATEPLLRQPSPVDTAKMQLLALPTIGIQLPQVENWLRYQIRYKCADRNVLGTAGRYYNRSFVPHKLGAAKFPSKLQVNSRARVRVMAGKRNGRRRVDAEGEGGKMCA
ncbi:hypothetical protein F4810DRAFT_667627 [Camillea tinctor]|nr:hypothetical protein F4810DRAFT_667627 [Camillea tinctor]